MSSLIPARLRDPLLKLHPSLFSYICVPLRIALGVFIIILSINISEYSTVIYVIAAVLLLIAVGLIMKSIRIKQRGVNVWKDYYRAILLLSVASISAFAGNASEESNLVFLSGLLVIIDAVAGRTTHFSARMI